MAKSKSEHLNSVSVEMAQALGFDRGYTEGYFQCKKDAFEVLCKFFKERKDLNVDLYFDIMNAIKDQEFKSRDASGKVLEHYFKDIKNKGDESDK